MKTDRAFDDSYDNIEFALPNGSTIQLRFYVLRWWIPRFAPGDRLQIGFWSDGFVVAIGTPWIGYCEGYLMEYGHE